MESVAVTLVLCLLAVASLMSSQRYFQLNSFAQAYLAANMVFCLIVGRAFPYTTEGMLWLLMAGGAWFLGGLIARLGPKVIFTRMTHRPEASPFDPSYRTVLVLSAIVAVPYVVLLSTVGFSFSSLLSYSTGLAKSRYEGEGVPLVITLLTVPLYLACMCAGIMSTRAHGLRSWAILLTPLLLAVLASLSQNAKAIVIYSVSLWVAGYLVSMSAQQRRIVSPMRLIAVLAGAYLLIELFTFMQAVRYGRDIATDVLLEVMSVYAAGHLSAFTLWFSDIGIDWSTPRYGTETFRSIIGALTGADNIQGFERHRVQLTHHYSTTVLTTFAELIQDFGRYGALVVIFLLSYFTGHLDHNIRTGRMGAVAVGTAACAVVIFSPISSLLNYTTILLAAVLLLMWEFSHVLRLPRAPQQAGAGRTP